MILLDVMREVARNLSDVREGLATGGTTTTLIDTNLSEPDDYFNGGVIFIDFATPQVAPITDWALSSKTFTIPTMPAATTGKYYTATTKRFPIDILKNSVNRALENEIGKVMLLDESITVVEDQLEYTLPDGVRDLRRVEYGNETDGFKKHLKWREEYGVLIFMDSAPSEDYLRIHYASKHPALVYYDDEINETVDRDYLVVAATYFAAIWRNLRAGDDEKINKNMVDIYGAELARTRATHQSILLNRDPVLSRL